MIAREESIIQTKAVVLIALLAISHDTSAAQLPGLAAIALVLGIVYWLMRERDDLAPQARI